MTNHNAVYIGDDILIGCFSSRSTKLVLESFMIFDIKVYMDMTVKEHMGDNPTFISSHFIHNTSCLSFFSLEYDM